MTVDFAENSIDGIDCQGRLLSHAIAQIARGRSISCDRVVSLHKNQGYGCANDRRNEQRAYE
jgi:hypothetical protein